MTCIVNKTMAIGDFQPFCVQPYKTSLDRKNYSCRFGIRSFIHSFVHSYRTRKIQ